MDPNPWSASCIFAGAGLGPLLHSPPPCYSLSPQVLVLSSVASFLIPSLIPMESAFQEQTGPRSSQRTVSQPSAEHSWNCLLCGPWPHTVLVHLPLCHYLFLHLSRASLFPKQAISFSAPLPLPVLFFTTTFFPFLSMSDCFFSLKLCHLPCEALLLAQEACQHSHNI